MLFFFGTGTSLIGSYPLRGIACQHCGTSNTVAATIYSRYLHLFWVPLIPLGKTSLSECAHCQQVLREAQLPPAYREPVMAYKQNARLPVSNYLALSIIAIGFLALMLVGTLRGNRQPVGRQLANVVGTAPSASAMREAMAAADPAANEPLLAAPQVADLYAMRNPDHHYSIMRVARVVPDTVYMQTSTHRLTELSDVDTQQGLIEKNLNAFLIPMPRANLVALNQTKLLTIVRK